MQDSGNQKHQPVKLVAGDSENHKEKLGKAKIVVFGCGAVASWALEHLARSGVGAFVLVDDALYERESLFSAFSSVQADGQTLVDAAEQRILQINSEANVVKIVEEPAGALAERVYEQHMPTLVVECTSMYKQKAEILELCVTRRIPTVSAMGAGRRRDIRRIGVYSLQKAYGCPLCKCVRKLIQFGEEPCNEVVAVVSTESALPGGEDQFEGVLPGDSCVINLFGIWVAYAANCWLTKGYFPLPK